MTLGNIRCHEAVIMYEKYKLGSANIKESFRVTGKSAKTAVQNPDVTQFLKPGYINSVTVIGNKFGLRYLKKRMSIL